MNIGTYAGKDGKGRASFMVDGMIRHGSQFARPSGHRSLKELAYQVRWNDAIYEGVFTGRDAEEACMRSCWNQLVEFGVVLEAKQAESGAWEAKRSR